MHLWPLAPDALRELDVEAKQVRRLEGLHLPTEREGRDGSWHAYFRVTTPIVVGEPVEIIWPARGRVEASLQSTITAPTVAVLHRAPRGPWSWASGDESGQSGLVTLEGRPAAQAPDLEAAFLMAHLLNAAEEMPDHRRDPDSRAGLEAEDHDRGAPVVSAVRAGQDGQRTVLAAGVVLAAVSGAGPAEERLLNTLGRWEAHPEVVAALAAVLRDLGSAEIVAVWDLPDPAQARQALVAGGLSAASVAALDRRGPESFRTVAQHAGRFAQLLDWGEAVRLVDRPPVAGARSAAELVATGEPEEAARLTDRLLRQTVEAHASGRG
jgi:hypothetical protein